MRNGPKNGSFVIISASAFTFISSGDAVKSACLLKRPNGAQKELSRDIVESTSHELLGGDFASRHSKG